MGADRISLRREVSIVYKIEIVQKMLLLIIDEFLMYIRKILSKEFLYLLYIDIYYYVY